MPYCLIRDQRKELLSEPTAEENRPSGLFKPVSDKGALKAKLFRTFSPFDDNILFVIELWANASNASSMGANWDKSLSLPPTDLKILWVGLACGSGGPVGLLVGPWVWWAHGSGGFGCLLIAKSPTLRGPTCQGVLGLVLTTLGMKF